MKKYILLRKRCSLEILMACFKNNKQTFVWKQKNTKINKFTGKQEENKGKKYIALSWLSPEWFFLLYDHLFIHYPWMKILSLNSLPIIFSQVPTSYGWFLLSFRCKSSWIFKLFFWCFSGFYTKVCVLFLKQAIRILRLHFFLTI